MLSLPILNMDPVLRLARNRDADLFGTSVRHSKLRSGIDVGETENIFPPIAP